MEHKAGTMFADQYAFQPRKHCTNPILAVQEHLFLSPTFRLPINRSPHASSIFNFRTVLSSPEELWRLEVMQLARNLPPHGTVAITMKIHMNLGSNI
jgi:hypothetical protein